MLLSVTLTDRINGREADDRLILTLLLFRSCSSDTGISSSTRRCIMTLSLLHASLFTHASQQLCTLDRWPATMWHFRHNMPLTGQLPLLKAQYQLSIAILLHMLMKNPTFVVVTSKAAFVGSMISLYITTVVVPVFYLSQEMNQCNCHPVWRSNHRNHPKNQQVWSHSIASISLKSSTKKEIYSSAKWVSNWVLKKKIWGQQKCAYDDIC